MGLSFSVFNKFKAVDGVTAPVRKMGKAVGRFGNKTVNAFKKADRQAFKFGKTLKAILVGGGLLAGVALLQQGIGSVTTSFVEFDDAIFAAGARFKDIGPDVEDFKKSIEGIKKAAREAGATTEFTATQSAQALDFLARAGFSSEESIGALNSMINLATSSGEEFARVADISSDLLGSFGLNSDNTAQKIKNLNRLNDVLVKTVNSANVTVEDMFETMKQVGPVATGIMGASLEEVAALTGVLGSSGIKGSEAMTALKNVFLRLAAPTSEANRLMKALNISMIDASSGEPRKITNVMEELGEKIGGLDKIKQAQVLDILFGKRAIAGGKNIIDNIKKIKEFKKAIDDSAGASQKTADVIRTSLGNRLKALGSAAQDFGFKILDAFEVEGKDAITAFTELIRNFDVKPIIKSLEKFLETNKELFKEIKPLFSFFKDSLSVLGDFLTYNEDLIPIIIGLTEVFVGLKIAMLAYNGVLIVTKGLQISTFGWIILAIGAIIFISKTLARNHDMLQEKFEFVAGFFIFMLGNMADKAREFGDKISIIFTGIGDRIRNLFENLGESIKNIFSGVGDFVGNIFTGIGDKVERKLSGVGSKIKGFFGFKDDEDTQTGTKISPNSGMINTIREERENKSRVDVNFSNLPRSAEVEKTGNTNGFNLTMGYSGG